MLVFHTTYAQQDGVRALYGVKSAKNIDDMENFEVKNIMISIASVLKDFEFELLISDHESLFNRKEQLKPDDISPYIYYQALVFSQGDKTWYVNDLEGTKIVEKNDSKPMTLLLDEKLEWDITKESKNFGDYKVYKATTVRQKGTVKTPVEAWFTSDLPYSFGPLGFGGLPGFIVELKFEEMIYTLNKIEKANVKIKKPKLNNQISYQEYYIMLEKEVADIKKKGY
ncbi:GLPGLI family protein [Muricauda sp. 40Bstr401]|mgnify:CR=1 FL=1|uniref:GLPGLI family protein n=4 Tax=Flagellimonas TaxID=444459 RepID=A0A6I5KZN0_9FLAO|nr:GLPGLI family protein [Allomuricauda sediminis]